MVGRALHVDPAREIARLPTLHYLCWYCSGQLPPSWTTVNGYRVHYGCRTPARNFVTRNAAEFLPPLPLG